MSDKKYHAFISYRHADNKEQGRQWATWLHQAIETYEVPADLVGNKNGRGETIPARIFPIFRDEEELPADSDLGNAIVSALDSTRLLIVLCSPRAVASTYVADEIDYFKKLGHSNRIIAAIIDGEPNTSWDKAKLEGDFTVEDECFPIPLQFEYDENGNRTIKHAEPIAADFRINNDGVPEQGWTTPEAYRLHLKQNTSLATKIIQKKVESYQKKQHLMLLKIIAGILGIALGELTQRDKEHQLSLERQKAKKLKRWLGVVVVLALLAVSAGILAYLQKEEAKSAKITAISERNSALVSQSRFLINLAENTSSSDQALLLLLNALPGTYGGERIEVDEAKQQLSTVLEKQKLFAKYPNKNTRILRYGKGTVSFSTEKVQLQLFNENSFLEFDIQNANSADLSYDEKYLLVVSGYSVTLFDVKSKKTLRTFEHAQDILNAQIDFTNRYIITNTVDNIKVWDADKGTLLKDINTQSEFISVHLSNDGKFFATVTQSGRAFIWSIDSLERIYSSNLKFNVKTLDCAQNSLVCVVFSEYGKIELVRLNGSPSIKIRGLLSEVESGHISLNVNPDFEKNIKDSLNKIQSGKSSTNGGQLYLNGGMNLLFLDIASSEIQAIVFESKIKHLSTSMDGNYVAVTLENRQLKIVSISRLQVVDTIKFESKKIAQTGSDSTYIHESENFNVYINSMDSEYIESEFESGEWLFEIPTRSQFSADSKKLFTQSAGELGQSKLWSLNPLVMNEIFIKEPSEDYQLSNDGLDIYISSGNNTYIRNIETGEIKHSFTHSSTVKHVKSSPSGKYLLTVSEGLITVWSLQYKSKVFELVNNDLYSTLNFAKKDKLLVGIKKEKGVTVWDITTTDILFSGIHSENYNSTTQKFLDDGLLIAHTDNKVLIRQAINGVVVNEFDWLSDTGPIDGVIINKPKQILVTSSNYNSSIIWSMENKKELFSIENELERGLKISPDGDYLINPWIGAFDKGFVDIYKTTTGEKLHELSFGSDEYLESSFSPDSKLIALSTFGESILINLKSGQKIETIEYDIGSGNPNVTFSYSGDSYSYQYGFLSYPPVSGLLSPQLI
jgi:hypothetical protein